jgi:hypothetical protein
MNGIKIHGVNRPEYYKLNGTNLLEYYNTLGLTKNNPFPTRKLSKNSSEKNSQKKSSEKNSQKNSENKSQKNASFHQIPQNRREKVEEEMKNFKESDGFRFLSDSFNSTPSINRKQRQNKPDKPPPAKTPQASKPKSVYFSETSLKEYEELTKNEWNKLSKSDNVTDIINNYYLDNDWENKINWEYLSQNSHAGELLADNPDKIKWFNFIYNKNILKILYDYDNLVEPYIKGADKCNNTWFNDKVYAIRPAYKAYMYYKRQLMFSKPRHNY